jgi:hypothetical protein
MMEGRCVPSPHVTYLCPVTCSGRRHVPCTLSVTLSVKAEAGQLAGGFVDVALRCSSGRWVMWLVFGSSGCLSCCAFSRRMLSLINVTLLF